MITQKQIDDYNYMLKASHGILLIKSEEKIYNNNNNNNYRNIMDILNNIEDIGNDVQYIGIGINMQTNEIFNKDVLQYQELEIILQSINKKFDNISIILTATINSLTEEKLILLKKYANVSIVIDLFPSFFNNNQLNLAQMKQHIKILKNKQSLLPKIHSFYIPYFVNYKIDKLLLKYWNEFNIDQYILYYCDNEINTHEYINYMEKMNSVNSIPLYTLEDIVNENYLKIINIKNFNNCDFQIGDQILKINNLTIAQRNDLYNYLQECEEIICNFHILRNNKELFIQSDKYNFINNIVLNNSFNYDFNELYSELDYNKEHILILIPDYNFKIFETKIKQEYSLDVNIEPLITKDIKYDNITLEDCEKALNNFRSNHSNQLITILWVPQKIITNLLNKGSKISIEDFQIKNMVFITTF